MIHENARAPRWPNAVAPGATRATAPPIQPVTMCDCGVGHAREPVEERVDEVVADRVEVVHPVGEPPAVRRRRVEHRLHRHVGHRARRGRARAGSSRAAARARARPRPGRRTSHADDRHAAALQLGRERRLRRRGEQHVEQHQLVGRAGLHQVAARAQGVARPLPRVHHRPGQHPARRGARGTRTASRRRSPRRRRAAPRTGPGARPRRPRPAAVGEHDVGREQRVDRQPVPAHQPADPAAEREPAHAGVRDLPGGHGEPVRLRRRVELARAARRRRRGRPRAPGRPRRRSARAGRGTARRRARSARRRSARRERIVHGRPAARAARTAAATSSASVARRRPRGGGRSRRSSRRGRRRSPGRPARRPGRRSRRRGARRRAGREGRRWSCRDGRADRRARASGYSPIRDPDPPRRARPRTCVGRAGRPPHSRPSGCPNTPCATACGHGIFAPMSWQEEAEQLGARERIRPPDPQPEPEREERSPMARLASDVGNQAFASTLGRSPLVTRGRAGRRHQRRTAPCTRDVQSAINATRGARHRPRHRRREPPLPLARRPLRRARAHRRQGRPAQPLGVGARVRDGHRRVLRQGRVQPRLGVRRQADRARARPRRPAARLARRAAR